MTPNYSQLNNLTMRSQRSKSRKQSKKETRKAHCERCTQCDYWMEKIKIYKRKIDRHIEQMYQSGIQTANFNSLANINYLNGTVASFGHQSLTRPQPNKRGNSS